MAKYTLKPEQIPSMIHTGIILEQQVSILNYHLRNKRVTHTIKAIVQCVHRLRTLFNKIQPDKTFVDVLDHTMRSSFEKRGLSFEYEWNEKDNTVYIHGSFKVEELRKRLIVLHVDEDIKPITTEHVNG